MRFIGRKNLIFLLILSFSTNVILSVNIMRKNVSQKENVPKKSCSNYSSFYYMNNPIDKYFAKKLEDPKICEAERKDYQERYLEVWKKQYNAITNLIEEKCLYKEDKKIYIKFRSTTEDNFKKIKPMLLAEILNNYSMKESLEKHSWGNGTKYQLDMYKGMIYRNQCMLFIPYIKGEYKFPEENDIRALIKNK